MPTAPTCMCALRSSSSRKSESSVLMRSYQVSMPFPAYLPAAGVARAVNPMHVAALDGFRTAGAARPMTLTQKILAAHARNLPRPWVQAGDILQVAVDWTIASELAWNGMERTYALLGPAEAPRQGPLLPRRRSHRRPGDAGDGQARAEAGAALARRSRRRAGIRHFYDANQTILHTKFYRDLVRPGELVLGADSHTSLARRAGRVRHRPGRRGHHRGDGAGRVVDRGAGGDRGRLPRASCPSASPART